MVVVLPAPLEPRKASISPSATCRSMPLTASMVSPDLVLYDFVRPFTSIARFMG